MVHHARKGEYMDINQMRFQFEIYRVGQRIADECQYVAHTRSAEGRRAWPVRHGIAELLRRLATRVDLTDLRPV